MENRLLLEAEAWEQSSSSEEDPQPRLLRRGLASVAAAEAAGAVSSGPTDVPAAASIRGGGEAPPPHAPWLTLSLPARVDHLVTPEWVGHECRHPDVVVCIESQHAECAQRTVSELGQQKGPQRRHQKKTAGRS